MTFYKGFRKFPITTLERKVSLEGELYEFLHLRDQYSNFLKKLYFYKESTKLIRYYSKEGNRTSWEYKKLRIVSVRNTKVQFSSLFSTGGVNTDLYTELVGCDGREDKRVLVLKTNI